MNIAKILVSGNLGADPEIKDVNNTKVANFSIAVNDKYTNSKGEKVEQTNWYRVEAWDGKSGGLVSNIIEPYARKGSTVLVEGIPVQETYTDKDGVEKRSFKIKLAGAGSIFRLGASSAPADSTPADDTPPSGSPVDGDDIPF